MQAGLNRRFVDAVRFVLKTGILWADLPERFGQPNTVWKRYDRWAAAGVWERVDRALGGAQGQQLSLPVEVLRRVQPARPSQPPPSLMPVLRRQSLPSLELPPMDRAGRRTWHLRCATGRLTLATCFH